MKCLVKCPIITPLFERWDFFSHFKILAFMAVYTFAQEFIARGILQTSLQDFLKDDKGYGSIFINAAFLFFFLYSLSFAIAANVFLVSISLGFIFLRQKTLLGTFLIHFFLLSLGILKY